MNSIVVLLNAVKGSNIKVNITMNNGINDRDEADEANHRSHLDAAHAEDFVVENRLVATCSTHKNEAKNNNQHSYCQDYEVGLVES